MVDTRIGRKIGDYEILERIGHGGMSEVFRAIRVTTGDIVALKLLHSFHAKDPNFLHRFQREAQAMARLNHPNIVRVYDHDIRGETPFIAMQFVPGGTLKERFKQSLNEGNLLPFEETAQIVIEIADALAFAHRHDMVHRDIKPANILFGDDGQAILTDFGIVKTMDGLTQHTATGAMIGTPAYMSPEQGLGRPGDARSDVYALGTLFFQMVTGKLPFDADKPLAVVLKHINDPIPFPTSINRDVPDGIETIILKALAKNPLDRFQTAQDMADALRAEVSNSEFAWAKRVPQGLLEAMPIGIQRDLEDEPIVDEVDLRDEGTVVAYDEPEPTEIFDTRSGFAPSSEAPALEPVSIETTSEQRVVLSPEQASEARKISVTSSSMKQPIITPPANAGVQTPTPSIQKGATAKDARGGFMYWVTMSLLALVLLSALAFAGAAVWGPLSGGSATREPVAGGPTATPLVTEAIPTATVVSIPVVVGVVTEEPTATTEPTATNEPTAVPTSIPTNIPTSIPTNVPTDVPATNPPPTVEVATEVVPTETPQPVEPTNTPQVDSADCVYSIELLNAFTYNIATNAAPIEARFPMNWTLRNNGTCTLPAGIRLVYESGESFGQSGAVELNDALDPGNQATITTRFISPDEPGRYDSRWQAYDQNNKPVGQELPFLVLIYELEPTPEATVTLAASAEITTTEVPTEIPVTPTVEPTAMPEPSTGELGYNVFIQQCEYAGADWRCLLQIIPLGDYEGPFTIWVNDGPATAEYADVRSQTHWAQAPRCEPWENAIQVRDNGSGETITREVALDPNDEPISTFLGDGCTP